MGTWSLSNYHVNLFCLLEVKPNNKTLDQSRTVLSAASAEIENSFGE